jgi:Putative polyhydroxyalkanoic acid system protein (PHA_gran_rgn)
MSKPLIVSIPHRLDKEEAVNRIKSGLRDVQTKYGSLFAVQEEVWTGSNPRFRVSALGQAVSGSINVADDHVSLEIYLPWLLAKIAAAIQPLIRKEGVFLLEKR